MTRDTGKFSWSKLPEGAEDVLGKEFWNDIQQLFPKKGPLIDMYETEHEGIILVELPGLHSINDIKIKLKDMNLVILGNIPVFSLSSNGKATIKERFTGPFERQIPLPFSFMAKNVTAKYQNGLLVIRLEKVVSEQLIDVHFE
ncbi:Hsp20/alpha crystallin family protein [Cytobacillus solani]|uniref:SHSP domain-containing protein n=1 Tax=Cytobacillus solani TaxID=1637975 RepID=A0A0Q3QUW5_9BACI|nr:Hsp20/alpha crystallin family protein [Cytobacillus solani]KQL21574.1 hypothetical protein AN957_25460 [Cytobacillus solani]USK54882.1 Hsp20/alpha crystallin family protein [Cytobacillus solani]